jgi:hypothetical protein
MKNKNTQTKTNTRTNGATAGSARLHKPDQSFLNAVHPHGKYRVGPFLMGIRNECVADEINADPGLPQTYIALVETPVFTGRIEFEHESWHCASVAIEGWARSMNGRVLALALEGTTEL